MAKEYIGREALLCMVQPDDPGDEMAAITIATAKKLIRSLVHRCPAADVVEVRHGKWVHSEIEDDDWGRIFHEWTCSVCGYSVAHNPTGENYCPNCGAKMDKEEV